MKTSKSKSLALVKTTAIAAPAVKPKMTKTIVIAAMVEQARKQHQAKQEQYETQRADIIRRLVDASRDALRQQINDIEIEARPGWQYQGAAKMANLDITIGSEAIREILREHNKLENVGSFREDEVRDRIRKSLDTTADQVAQILSVPDNVEVIEQVLRKISL